MWSNPELGRRRFCPVLLRKIARLAAGLPSGTLPRLIAGEVYDRDPQAVFDALGPRINAHMSLANLAFDLEPADHLDFEDLAGLMPSTPLSFGVALMTPRQLAYLFGLARRSGVRTAIEIGRFKGGAALAIAAGMGANGTLWSIDTGALEARQPLGGRGESFDDQLRRTCERFALDVRLLVGDSSTVDLDVDGVDLVLIDGDHSYEGAKSDFQRWGNRVRVGGHVLMDDALPLDGYVRFADVIGRVVAEVLEEGRFREVRSVDRIVHLQRVE
jgi:predicted O-methyltransferase YrrM